MWLLDTNAWIAYINPNPNPIKTQITSKPLSAILMCDIVKAELFYGAFRSSHINQNLANLNQLFSLVRSLPFDSAAARNFGEIRAHLAQQGTPIGPYDLQIAAIALAHGLILVTHNTREFSRVPGLHLVDWELV
jgi:tRNA(fMet)-specific endonuclease VapC